MYYGLPIEERLPPPPLTEIAPFMDQPQPKHHVPTVPLLTFEVLSPEKGQTRQHGFFTDVPASSETVQAPPSSSVVSQRPAPVTLPSSETFEIGEPESGASPTEAGVAPPSVVFAAQATEAAPGTSQDGPFSAPAMEWDATR
jgi:hypothetical protein